MYTVHMLKLDSQDKQWLQGILTIVIELAG